jgi:hypothetical protein
VYTYCGISNGGYVRSCRSGYLQIVVYKSLNKEIFKVIIYRNIYRFSIKKYSIKIHIINIKSLKVISVFYSQCVKKQYL